MELRFKCVRVDDQCIEERYINKMDYTFFDTQSDMFEYLRGKGYFEVFRAKRRIRCVENH